jgi:exocyst complex component 2
VLRRRIAATEKPTLFASAIHLKSPARPIQEDKIKHLDTGPILELWELIIYSMNNLLSLQGGVLGEVVDFWDKAQSFIDGKAQRTLPTGIDGSSRKHHRLSSDGVRDLQSGAVELVELLREHIFSFFADPPIEDVSLLFSPLPTESPNTPRSATLSPFTKPDHRFQHDLLSPPPPSPKRGEAWEEFAFWPPYANSLSGVHYLGKLLALLGTAASEMAAIRPVANGNGSSEKLKALLGAARERSARAICAAWNADAELCKVLEDWTRNPEQRETTRMPFYFSAFESFVLSGAQKILYIPEAVITKRGLADVITPPPNKLLQMVRSQFVTSLYKTLSGMVENAERPVNLTQNPWATEQRALLGSKGTRISIDISRDAIDASKRVRYHFPRGPAPRSHLFKTNSPRTSGCS